MSSLQPYPYSDSVEFKGYGLARAWHVWFSAFGPVSSGPAAIVDFVKGRPTKVVIHADPDAKKASQLIGTDCSTGAPLHFCYNDPNNCDLVGRSLTENELVHSGTDHLTIEVTRSVDYTGYMLFPRPGRYLLSVLDGSTTLGSVTLGVS